MPKRRTLNMTVEPVLNGSLYSETDRLGVSWFGVFRGRRSPVYWTRLEAITWLFARQGIQPEDNVRGSEKTANAMNPEEQ